LFDHLKLPRRGIAVPRRGVFKGTGRKCCFNCKRLLVVTFDNDSNNKNHITIQMNSVREMLRGGE
jgi:hypothetical protein